MSSSAERMARLRAKRKQNKLKEVRFWVREEDVERAREVAQAFEDIALLDERKHDKAKLVKNLDDKLKAFRSWQNYYFERYGLESFNPSTERQRKYAYFVSKAAKVQMPDSFILADRQLLHQWIRETIHSANIGRVYTYYDNVAEHITDNQGVVYKAPSDHSDPDS